MEVNSKLHVPAALLPGKNRCTYCIAGSVGSRTGPEVSEEREISFPHRDSNSETSSL